jgi:peptide/nickel transport system substrate-binding protein
MKTRSKVWLIISSLIILSMVLAACGTPTPEIIEREVVRTVEVQVPGEEREVIVTVEVPGQDVEIIVTPEPVVIDRQGTWLDTIVVVEEPSADAAVSRLATGDIDVYAFTVGNPAVVSAVEANSALGYERSFGSYNELSFNPVGPVFETTGKLNPFSVARVREAMNMLVDREYIGQEIMGGLGVPRWFAINNASPDYATYAAKARELEGKYAYNPEEAERIISEEMEELGAELVSGVWNYNGEPVEISVLIRTEDERRQVGDYVASQLESIGFTAIRDYKTAAEASPIWINGDPAEGRFHIYTGGWISTAIVRDLGANFEFFYLPAGLGSPLWAAYQPTEEFEELATRLANNDFTTLEERRELYERVMDLSMEDSSRVWLVDRIAIAPRRGEISVAADLFGSIAGSRLWPYTLRRGDEVGGSLTMAMPSILTNPWNAIGGSNWIYDQALVRATQDWGVINDPYTGLWYPQRVESGTVTVLEGLPVGQTLDWFDLEFTSEITVPDDAWVDWDATEQRFITASEKFTETQTANFRTTVVYPADLFDTVRWHDGSPLSVGDFVFRMIIQFDRAKQDSPYFDQTAVAAFNSFMSSFKGFRVTSTSPLTIEHYGDNYSLDAEDAMTWTWWPNMGFGPSSWHATGVGLRGEGNGEAAHTSGKADANQVEYFSYIAGPTIDVLTTNLAGAVEEGWMPYEATLSEYVTAEEMETRYTNLQEFFRRRGHYWVGTGPFFLQRAFPVEGTVILNRNPDFPDQADKWSGFSAPPIPEVELDGPGRVTIGQSATFEVFVEYGGQPYPAEDLSGVTYLLFDASNTLVATGEATGGANGVWEITLGGDVTGQLEAGSNRLEAVVVSNRVALPAFEAMQFVTAP